MLDIHQDQDSRTITVRSEGFARDFDASVTAILRHVLPEMSRTELDDAAAVPPLGLSMNCTSNLRALL